MNLGDLIFRTSHKSGLADDVPDEHTMMLGWARDAVLEVLLLTHCTVETGSMVLTPQYSLYTIDPVVLAVLTAQCASQGSIFDVEVTQLERIRSRQRVGSSSPVQMLAVEGDRLYVYPTPTEADSLTWDYVPRPAQQLTLNTDDPSATVFGRIPPEYHRALEYYMLWQAAEYDDRKLAQSPDDFFKRFQQECQQVHRRRLGKRGRTPMRPLIGYPGASQTPSRNDMDVAYG